MNKFNGHDDRAPPGRFPDDDRGVQHNFDKFTSLSLLLKIDVCGFNLRLLSVKGVYLGSPRQRSTQGISPQNLLLRDFMRRSFYRVGDTRGKGVVAG